MKTIIPKIISSEIEPDKEKTAKLHHDFLAVIRTFKYLADKDLQNTDNSEMRQRKQATVDSYVSVLNEVKSQVLDKVFPLDSDT